MAGITVSKKELLGNSFTSCILLTFWAEKKEEEKGMCILIYHHMPIHYDTLQHSNVPHKRRYKVRKKGQGENSLFG